MHRKAQLQISFGWLFAIIVGIFILFIAIYISTKIIDSGKVEIDTSTAKKLDVLLNPLETSFESSKTTSIVLNSDTRIYNKCDNAGYFGNQKIQVAQESFGDFSDVSIDVSFDNKYIFSDDFIEGKKFYVFSKPFEYPFKVTDLIFLTSKEYCFLDAPEEIEEEISEFQENIKLEDCSEEGIQVCFMKQGCDVDVSWGGQYLDKNGKRLYFTKGFIYGAIFSDAEIYECQVKRIMQRAEQLLELYKDKSDLLNQRECYSEIDIDLENLKVLVENFESSEDFDLLNSDVNDLEQKNERSDCRLW